MEFVCCLVRQRKNAPVLSLWPSLSFSQRIFIEFFRESDLRFSSIYYDEDEGKPITIATVMKAEECLAQNEEEILGNGTRAGKHSSVEKSLVQKSFNDVK